MYLQVTLAAIGNKFAHVTEALVLQWNQWTETDFWDQLIVWFITVCRRIRDFSPRVVEYAELGAIEMFCTASNIAWHSCQLWTTKINAVQYTAHVSTAFDYDKPYNWSTIIVISSISHVLSSRFRPISLLHQHQQDEDFADHHQKTQTMATRSLHVEVDRNRFFSVSAETKNVQTSRRRNRNRNRNWAYIFGRNRNQNRTFLLRY